MCSAAEHQAVDSVIDGGPKLAGYMDLKVVEGKQNKSYIEQKLGFLCRQEAHVVFD